MRENGGMRSKKAEKTGLLYEINDLLQTDRLLQGTHVQVEDLEREGAGKNEIVHLRFSVSSHLIENKDPTSGAIRVSGGDAHFDYTFTGQMTLEQNLREFRQFYELRSQAGPPEVKKLQEMRAGHSASVTGQA
jgi:hypothetical protein